MHWLPWWLEEVRDYIATLFVAYGYLWISMDAYGIWMYISNYVCHTNENFSSKNPALGTLMQSLESKDELPVATLVLTLGPVICFCGLQNVKAAK